MRLNAVPSADVSVAGKWTNNSSEQAVGSGQLNWACKEGKPERRITGRMAFCRLNSDGIRVASTLSFSADKLRLDPSES
ncbi:unnamed protein product [Protopolystoma xenopodis]|uniref:Uncharacterized protein n=1 Tax=Protopolystoma xenopodis TaxID=117903 RepID=A0A3S5A2L8_9PLAT|nr:unnamed protein product [Protopolystoma xenopodis]